MHSRRLHQLTHSLGSRWSENYECPETNVNYPPIPEIYGFKRRYTEYSLVPYFPIVSVYVRAKGCYPKYWFQLWEICKSTSDTNEHVRSYGVSVCQNMNKWSMAVIKRRGREKNKWKDSSRNAKINSMWITQCRQRWRVRQAIRGPVTIYVTLPEELTTPSYAEFR